MCIRDSPASLQIVLRHNLHNTGLPTASNPVSYTHLDVYKRQEKRADYAELYRAVNSLKEELRLPVILYYIEDFNIREIAQILDITEGAVQKRLARARGKLRMNLQESEAAI